MTTYGYIRTSRDQDPGHPGSDPEVQHRQLADVGVEPGRIYADVAVSGTTSGSSRAQWQLLDKRLTQGDVLVVAAVDRLGRRYLETMWAIYDLQRRGVRLRSLAGNEGEWTKFLDADPDSPEAFMGNILASCGRGGCVVASFGCSFSGVGFPFKNHYPRFRGAPFHAIGTPLIYTPSVDSGLKEGRPHPRLLPVGEGIRERGNF